MLAFSSSVLRDNPKLLRIHTTLMKAMNLSPFPTYYPIAGSRTSSQSHGDPTYLQPLSWMSRCQPKVELIKVLIDSKRKERTLNNTDLAVSRSNRSAFPCNTSLPLAAGLQQFLPRSVPSLPLHPLVEAPVLALRSRDRGLCSQTDLGLSRGSTASHLRILELVISSLSHRSSL